MKTYKSLLALGVAIGVIGVSQALADVQCPPHLGAVTVENVAVTGVCTMDHTTVTGNVIVQTNANLLARDVRVEGNVQAEDARRVQLLRSNVGGSVQLFGTHGANASRIIRTDVGGSIQIEDSTAPVVIRLNTVDADVQAFQNTGGVTIESNTIGGNLQCKANNPAPIGGNNIVAGNKEDQCQNF